MVFAIIISMVLYIAIKFRSNFLSNAVIYNKNRIDWTFRLLILDNYVKPDFYYSARLPIINNIHYYVRNDKTLVPT